MRAFINNRICTFEEKKNCGYSNSHNYKRHCLKEILIFTIVKTQFHHLDSMNDCKKVNCMAKWHFINHLCSSKTFYCFDCLRGCYHYIATYLVYLCDCISLTMTPVLGTNTDPANCHSNWPTESRHHRRCRNWQWKDSSLPHTSVVMDTDASED